MNVTQTTLNEALEQKAKGFIIKLLKLEDTIDLKVDVDLIQQIGLDSIEAFDAVATMHQLIGVPIPDDFDPNVVRTVRSLCRYLSDNYGKETLDGFLTFDLNSLTSLRKDEEEL